MQGMAGNRRFFVVHIRRKSMKRSYFVAAALVAIAIAVGVLAVPESQPLAHTLMASDPLSWAPLAIGIGMTAPVTSKKIRELQAKKAKQIDAMRALSDKAEGAFSAEDQKAYDELKASVDSFNAAIAREAELVAEEAQLGVLEVPAGSRIQVHERAEDDPKRGFRSFGHFAQAVRRMPGQHNGYALGGQLHIGGGDMQAAAPSTFGSEGPGPDGGFAIPPDFATEIFTHTLGEDSLLPLTDGVTIGANSMVFPKDETTPWGTDGLRAYWQQEGTSGTPTKPKLSELILRLYKLMALVPLSDELLADTNALNSYLPKKVGDSIRWKTNEAILFGSGAGQPLGAFNGNAVVTVAKESGQATLTLQALNLAKMIARLPAGSFGRAFWLLNNDVLPALFTLTLGNYPIYLPGGAIVGGLQLNPYGTLLGRPILVSQHAKSFTNQGDVLLLDPQYVRSIQKAAGVETATSMHIYFDADATAFRTIFRVDAQPKIVNVIAPFNGSNNLSPFVQLGAR
jgi:HK97 family phage major capsid protein